MKKMLSGMMAILIYLIPQDARLVGPQPSQRKSSSPVFDSIALALSFDRMDIDEPQSKS